jgi:SurA N-terminal domain/Prokaryotic membrane lipoprotein lipid attachment site
VKKSLALVFALIAFVLSGCSQVNSAATVGDREIALKELQSQVDLILSERNAVDTSQMQLETGEDLTRTQLSYLISNLIIEELAKEQNIEITASELESYKSQIFENIGGEANLPNVLVNASIPSTGLEQVLRRDLVLRKISEKESAAGADESTVNSKIEALVTEKAKSLKVTINPRYGVWDVKTLSVVAAEPAGDAVTDK